MGDHPETSLIKEYKPVFYDQMNTPDEGFKKDIGAFHLKTSVYNCYVCPLHQYRKTVPMSNFHASFMIITQDPQELNPQTEHGKMLYQILQQLHFDLNDIYFTSAVKCEGSTEYMACHHHLVSELILIQPLVIVALGYYAGAFLMNSATSIQPGDTITLATGSDLLITYSLKDITPNSAQYNWFIKHLSMAKAQLEYRKAQKEMIRQ
jgi:uracil-DNA glycosylase family 4